MKKRIIAAVIGLIVAIAIIAFMIYLGYQNAYNLGSGETYLLTLFGIQFYQLEWVDGAYVGSANNLNMGLISLIYIVIAIVIEELYTRIKK